jgi:hypothetical protein
MSPEVVQIELSEDEKDRSARKGIIQNFEHFKQTGTLGSGRLWSYQWLYEHDLLPKHTEKLKQEVRETAIKRLEKKRSDPKASSSDRKKIIGILKQVAQGKDLMKSECQAIILERFYGSLIIKKIELKNLLT